MSTAGGQRFVTRIRGAHSTRIAAATEATRRDILARWVASATRRVELDPETVARTVSALIRTGLSPDVATTVVHRALEEAARAFRHAVLQHGTELASDSENTDTGKMAKLQ